MDESLKQNLDSFITLAEASKLTGYHQDYLGFLCRTGKLQGFKIGRNWTTTNQALNEFLQNFKNGVSEVTDETGKKIPVHVIAKPDEHGSDSAGEHGSRIGNQTVVVEPVQGSAPSVEAQRSTSVPASVSSADQPQYSLSHLKKDVLESIDSKVKNLSESVAKIAAKAEEHAKVLQQQIPQMPVIRDDRHLGRQGRTGIRDKLSSNFNLQDSIDQELPSFKKVDETAAPKLDVKKLYASFNRLPKFNFAKFAPYALASLAVAAFAGSVFWNSALNNPASLQPGQTTVVYQNTKHEDGPLLATTSPQSQLVIRERGVIQQLNNQTLGFSDAYFYSLIDNRLNKYLAEGKFKGEKGDQGLAGSAAAGSGYLPISFVQAPVVNGPGNAVPGSIGAVTHLSSVDFMTDTATIKSATVNTQLTVSGNSYFNGSTTILNLSTASFNPNFTLGSVVYQGSNGLTQDNANLFYDATNKMFAVGTNTPAAVLTVVGSGANAPLIIASSSGTSLLTVLANGYLGVNTSTPGSLVSVQGQAGSDEQLVTVASSSGASYFTISSTGSVGINTSSPQSTLAIQGSGGLSSFTVSSSSGDTLLTIVPNGYVGIGTSSPVARLSVAGDAFFSGSVTLGSNLTVGGGSVVVGNSTTTTLSINASIGSHLIPTTNATFNIGNPSYYWKDIYVQTVHANLLASASSSIAGTLSDQFTINSDNSSSDTEDAQLIFFRGSVVPNALISWNSSAKRFELNQPAYVRNESSNTTTIPTMVLQASSGQTGDILQALGSSGANYFNVTASGNVGIGTGTPGQLLTVNGNAYVNGALIMPAAIAIGQNTLASGSRSVAIGVDASVPGRWSVAVGDTASANSDDTVAIGDSSSASGFGSVALGGYATAKSSNGFGSIAIGNQAVASTTRQAIAIGVGANAQFDYSVALGSGATTNAANQLMVGSASQNLNTVINGSLVTTGGIGIGSSVPSSTLTVAGTTTAVSFNASNPYALLQLDNTPVLRITGTGSWNDNVIFGRAAGVSMAAGLKNTIIGSEAGHDITSGSSNTFVGLDAGYNSTTGSRNTFMGAGTGNFNQTGNDNTYIGFNSGIWACANSNYNVFLGSAVDAGCVSGVQSSIAIGYNAQLSASNTLMIGSSDANGGIYQAYLGQGVTKVSPAGITLFATGGSGTNNAGGNFGISGGRGTGNASGGSILFITSDPLTSGSAAQPTSTKAILTASGLFGIGTTSPIATLSVMGTSSAPSTNLLTVASSSGTQILTVTASGRVGIGSTSPTNTLEVVGSIGNTYSSASANLSLVSSTSTDPVPSKITIAGQYAYVGINTAAGRLNIFDLSNPRSPRLVATSSPSLQFMASPIIVTGRYLFVKEFGKLDAFDISNPLNPVKISSVSGLTDDLMLHGKYIFGSGPGGQVTIYNISNPYAITVAATLPGIGSVGNGNGVTAYGNRLYVSSSNVFGVYDITNPAAPVLLGTSTISAFDLAPVVVSDRYVYVSNINGLSVVDVSNPAAPFQSTTLALTGNGCTTSIKPVVSGRYVYVLCSSAIWVVDASNPAAPVSLGGFSATNAGTAGFAVHGRYLYYLDKNNSTLNTVDLSGTETTTLTAGSGQIGTLSVENDAVIAGGLSVLNRPLTVGYGGIYNTGNLVVLATTSPSYFAGGVGIGTTSPISTFAITGTSGTNPFTIVSPAGTQMIGLLQNGNFAVGNTTTPTALLTVQGTAGATTDLLNVASSSNASLFVVKPSGNVGIGTTSPSANLHVVSSSLNTPLIVENTMGSGVYAQFKDSGVSKGYIGYSYLGTGGMAVVNAAGTTANLMVTNAGNVGIGTTSPSQTLTVSGNGYITGSLGVGVASPVATLQILGPSGDVGQTGIMRFDTNSASNNVGLKIGAVAGSGASGYSYIQSVFTGISNNASLILNPSAGNVGIGTASPASRLDLGSLSVVSSAGNIITAALSGGGSGSAANIMSNTVTLSSGSVGDFNAISNNLAISNGGSLIGVNNALSSSNSGEVIGAYNSGTISAGTGYGLKTVLSTNNDATLETIYGTYYDGTTYSGSTDTSYGHYVKSNSASTGGTQYGLYVDLSAGTATKYPAILLGGNVGIGTTSPSQLLTVGNNNQFTVSSVGNIYSAGSITTNSYLKTYDNTGHVFGNDNDYTIDYYAPTDNLEFIDGSTPGSNVRMVINNQGNVGIGTTTPASNFALQGSSGQTANLFTIASSSGASVLTVGSSGNFTLQPTANSATAFVINNASGNSVFSIDTTAPAVTDNIFTVASSSGANLFTVNGYGVITMATSASTSIASVITADGNITIGDDGLTGGTDGRIWIRSRGTTFRFNSDANTADYSEFFYQFATTTREVGTVMVSDSSTSSPVADAGAVKVSARGYDSAIVGVVTNRGTSYNNPNDDRQFGGHYVNVGMLGHIPVKVTNENGEIHAGDYITSSASRPGYAMKASRSGMVIGAALADFNGTTGTVLALVKPGYQIINNRFVLGENDGQLATATSTIDINSIASSSLVTAFLIDQKGSGDLLNLQQNGVSRLLVNNNGSFNLFASTTVATSTILTVTNGTTTQFSITAAGHITVGQDTAGTATIKAGDNQTAVTFAVPYDTVPKISVSFNGLPDFYYGVATKTPEGFTVQMSKPAEADATFDWIALAQPLQTVSASSQAIVVVSSPQNQSNIVTGTSSGSGDEAVSTDSTEVNGSASSTTSSEPAVAGDSTNVPSVNATSTNP